MLSGFSYSEGTGMKRTLVVLLLVFLAVAGGAAQSQPGHHLPDGTYHPVRERTIDIERVTADLRFDLRQESLAGTVTVQFTPLRSGLREFALDAAGLDVARVETVPEDASLPFELRDRQLHIRLPGPVNPGDELSVRIKYSVQPKTGMYFFPATQRGSAQAWNYGEGGLHYGWLPLYNDTNDRFAWEAEITVAPPYVALSNGRLVETRDNPDGSRTFHWVQEEPIPNYLISLEVGEFSEVKLEDARVGEHSVPLSVWSAPGEEDAAEFAFKDTPRMVEFFSRRFGYPYAWNKYDQVLLRDFAVGAMETTTMVGFDESHAHRPGDPPDSAPLFDEAYPTWTYEDTIAHELAHHWFGDLVTCRSLGSIWLNESFATFAHTLWSGHAHGEDALTYQRWRYLNSYLGYVRRTGEVRPMEYLRYRAPEDIYQSETTYIKGSLVLHMMRHFVGDDDFYRSLSAYLKKNQFSTAESVDLWEAFADTTGHNLSWFFQDWITEGGGHPSLDVSYRWNPERRQVDLTVRQVQADLPFENDFRLPVDVEVVTASGSELHRVLLEGWETQVSLPAEQKPLAVVFDKGNWLVAEINFRQPLQEVLYLLRHGQLAEQLRAARQLAGSFSERPEAKQVLAAQLADPQSFWGLRVEAATDLGMMGGPEATQALVKALGDGDRLIRRAAALALGKAGGEGSVEALRNAVESDPAEDVVAVAATALGRLRAPGAADFLKAQLGRESRWFDAIRVGALEGLAELQDASLVPTFREHTATRYPYSVRVEAIQGWFRAAPADPALAQRLRELARDGNRKVRGEALEKLGKLHRHEDLAFLNEMAAGEPDPNFAERARAAAAEVEAFTAAAPAARE